MNLSGSQGTVSIGRILIIASVSLNVININYYLFHLDLFQYAIYT